MTGTQRDQYVLPLQWRVRMLVLLSLGIVACFAKPLYQLAQYAWNNELHSHILLVPFISIYFIWKKWPLFPVDPQPRFQLGLALPMVAGLSLLAYLVAWLSSRKLTMADFLPLVTLSFLLLLVGTAVVLLGWQNLRPFTFPILFSFLMVPLPAASVSAIESFLQHHSGDVAYAFFSLSGMPVVRDGMAFRLPGFSLEVAPECSGIHSTLALFVTSLVAGYILLQRPWARAVLAVAVVPLALLRNGFRVFVIGQLCVHISPDMIDSPIHRRGGPLFFLLSLIPFFLLLLWLRRTESKHLTKKAPENATALHEI